MAIGNKQLIQTITINGSEALQTALKNVDLGDGTQVYNALKGFDGLKNEFLNSLINKVVKTQFFSKVYNNPLRMLHNGVLEFGDTIEQVYIGLGERKGFQDHFDANGSSEKDLIGKRLPSVNVDYITQNYEHKYKVTVSNIRLQRALASKEGLSQLVSDLIGSNLNTAYRDEYNDMKGILTRDKADAEKVDGHKFEKGIIQQIAEHKTLKDKAIVKLGKQYKPQDICETIRSYSLSLGFYSKDYNLAEVETFSQSDELVFFTTPDISAKIDVNVLAQAFNVSSADIKPRTIIIKDIPKLGSDNVLGILADKNLIQAWDTVNETATFYNGEQLSTNYFLHKHGIMASCKFAQCIVITDGQ